MFVGRCCYLAAAKYSRMENPSLKQDTTEHDQSEKNLEMKKVQQKLKDQISGLKKIQKASSQKE